MAIKLKLRGLDGKFVKGEVKHLEKAITRFGSNVIKDGRKILHNKKKTTQGNTLYSDYHYTMKSTKSTIELGLEFGDADDYWQYVDQGVKGTGSKGGRSKTTGQFTRGAGSPFKFKYDNPGGALVNAIRGWIKNKPISLGDSNEIGTAFAIGYSIKRRGLERTMFVSRPVEVHSKKIPDEVTEAFLLDVESLIGKLPSKQMEIQVKL
mgnify:FL=1|tara:strand:+ start:2576 stop:3196 length:621 start_codon:yes stop_codon:yes gene_type:complete